MNCIVHNCKCKSLSFTNYCGRHTKRCKINNCRKAKCNDTDYCQYHLKDFKECVICCNYVASKTILQLKLCSHSFCNDCITKWIQNEKYTCPLCRTYIVRHRRDLFDLSIFLLNIMQIKELFQIIKKYFF